MAEEQFTSRRARREAERVAADQAFEARDTPEEPSEPASNGRADLLKPAPAPVEKPDSHPTEPEPEPADTTSRVDAEPAPRAVHDRGALATDHPVASRPPVNAEDRLDPQRTPLPHFETRTARKQYLRDHGLSLEGDVSTGALPVIAEPEESVNDTESEEGLSSEPESVDPESFDTAGFGGSADEVAARDFESPITPDSSPRPATLDEEPMDALSRPIENLDSEDAPATEEQVPEDHAAETTDSVENIPEEASSEVEGPEDVPAAEADDADEPSPRARSRRMPIVQPPSTSGVRVVTAASAQIPEADTPEPGPKAEASGASTTESASALDQTMDSEAEAGADTNAGTDTGAGANDGENASSSDDAARALAANPETRPMDTVPEAWALPNPDYEDEETENPPGTRIRASDVTGHDGRILVGEEPSKVPFVVLGVAAIFAVALIVIALVMLL